MKASRPDAMRAIIRGLRIAAVTALLFALSGQARAADPVVDLGDFPGCFGCTCENSQHIATRAVIQSQEVETRQYIHDKFEEHQSWLTNDFYMQWVMPAMKMMNEQLVTNGMNQMMALGGIFDAKDQLETQRLLQQRTAEAHKDYQTSTEVCVMGTANEFAASTERRGVKATHVMAMHGLNRQLGTLDGAAADGPEADSVSRMDRVRSQYCNPNDNNRHMQYICDNGGGPLARRNRDVDFARYMGDSLTLQMDMEGGANAFNDQQDILALQSYLYVNHPFTRMTLAQMKTQEGQELWMKMRAVMAKHAVAENSFDNIMGMKAQAKEDAQDTGELMAVIYRRMGLGVDAAEQVLARGSRVGAGGAPNGPTNRPSYYATLQTLSRALYQNPSFYVNLYDTPANIKRKDVAMQAISLMVDREAFNSELREEAVLSQILEAEVIKAQDRLQNATYNMNRANLQNPPAEAAGPQAPMPINTNPPAGGGAGP